MNSLSFSWIYYLFREFPMNPLFASRFLFEFTIFSRNQYEFTICFAVTMNTLSASRFHLQSTFRQITMNSLSFSWIHYLFREFPMNPLFASRFLFEFTIFSRNQYEFTICFAVTMNTLSASRFHLQSTFRQITMNSLSFSWIHQLFREFPMN